MISKYEEDAHKRAKAKIQEMYEGMKSFVGLTAAEAKYEEIAQKRIEEKISTLVDKYMDIDGDGNLTEAEVVKFHSLLSGNEEATAEDLDKDMKVLVGLTAAEAKAKIQEMCGGDEEKLDFILSKYE